MDINKYIKDLVNGLGAMAEVAAVYRDKLIENGFTREEAVTISAEFVRSLTKPDN